MQKSSINKVILVGHIGNKPEIRYTPSGTAACSFSIATNETWIDNEKEKQERTEWHNLIAWAKLADFVAEYIQKGQLVYVEGKLQTRSWTDKDKINRKITEIVCSSITPLEWKSGHERQSNDDSKSNDSDLPF